MPGDAVLGGADLCSHQRTRGHKIETHSYTDEIQKVGDSGGGTLSHARTHARLGPPLPPTTSMIDLNGCCQAWEPPLRSNSRRLETR